MLFSKPVYRLLRGESALAGLVGRAERLSHIERQLDAILGPPLGEHCRVANLYRDTLVVFTDSPAWGARLRYAAPTALARLKERDPTLATLEHLTVKVRPIAEPPSPAPTRPRGISPEAAMLVATVAEGTDDPDLRAAFRRLARRVRAD